MGAAGFGLAASAAVSARAAADPLSGAALYADVKAYAALGEHRTGTAGDQACTAWLERALKREGYAVERQGFDYPVFDLEAATVTVDGASVPAFPLWTPAAGQASARITAEPARGAIAVLRFPFGTGHALEVSQAWRKPVEAAIAAGASGVVAVTENPLGELVAFNCAPKQPAWPVPVVAVAARSAALLATGSEGRISIAGAMRQGRAENLVARRPGTGKPLIVSTPKSGWFECAGERGSGIAIWLGLARRLAATDRNLVFMAASGHEFDGYGGHLFAEHLAPGPAEARGWVHIGANVASYDFALADGRITRLDHPQVSRLAAASEALLPVARKAFAGQLKYEAPIDIDKERAPGEIAEYQRRGYAPLFSLVGSHVLHHTRRDLPDVTSPAMLEPVARGLAAVVEAI
ncbi:hypothetical protein DJ017_05340 [Phenylobacterium soli]|uniref:Peptidase M28 domain-containing protein n=1 Tax=Phenylobacterium soli TaxID=2170551 RepID=A0A328AHJ8_9CAUL|nr:hypothetical protein DJ017_05340 [Phenylobacterium soli]